MPPLRKCHDWPINYLDRRHIHNIIHKHTKIGHFQQVYKLSKLFLFRILNGCLVKEWSNSRVLRQSTRNLSNSNRSTISASPVQSEVWCALAKGNIFTEHNPSLYISDLSSASSSHSSAKGSSVWPKVHKWWWLATCINTVSSGDFTAIELTTKCSGSVDPSPSGLALLSSHVRKLSLHWTGLQWIMALVKA